MGGPPPSPQRAHGTAAAARAPRVSQRPAPLCCARPVPPSPQVKLDKSGKALLTLLRHLGRLSEQRCSVDGAQLVVYVLCDEARG